MAENSQAGPITQYVLSEAQFAQVAQLAEGQRSALAAQRPKISWHKVNPDGTQGAKKTVEQYRGELIAADSASTSHKFTTPSKVTVQADFDIVLRQVKLEAPDAPLYLTFDLYHRLADVCCREMALDYPLLANRDKTEESAMMDFYAAHVVLYKHVAAMATDPASKLRRHSRTLAAQDCEELWEDLAEQLCFVADVLEQCVRLATKAAAVGLRQQNHAANMKYRGRLLKLIAHTLENMLRNEVFESYARSINEAGLRISEVGSARAAAITRLTQHVITEARFDIAASGETLATNKQSAPPPEHHEPHHEATAPRQQHEHNEPRQGGRQHQRQMGGRNVKRTDGKQDVDKKKALALCKKLAACQPSKEKWSMRMEEKLACKAIIGTSWPETTPAPDSPVVWVKEQGGRYVWTTYPKVKK